MPYPAGPAPAKVSPLRVSKPTLPTIRQPAVSSSHWHPCLRSSGGSFTYNPSLAKTLETSLHPPTSNQNQLQLRRPLLPQRRRQLQLQRQLLPRPGGVHRFRFPIPTLTPLRRQLRHLQPPPCPHPRRRPHPRLIPRQSPPQHQSLHSRQPKPPISKSNLQARNRHSCLRQTGKSRRRLQLTRPSQLQRLRPSRHPPTLPRLSPLPRPVLPRQSLPPRHRRPPALKRLRPHLPQRLTHTDDGAHTTSVGGHCKPSTNKTRRLHCRTRGIVPASDR